MKNKIRLALAQMSCIVGDKEKNLNRMEELTSGIDRALEHRQLVLDRPVADEFIGPQHGERDDGVHERDEPGLGQPPLVVELRA